jgi:hypothetical protein
MTIVHSAFKVWNQSVSSQVDQHMWANMCRQANMCRWANMHSGAAGASKCKCGHTSRKSVSKCVT